MTQTHLTPAAVAAVSTNRIIGQDGKIPWHLPDDLRRFKELTTGHAVLMGRKTHESIGRPLPNRINLVLSRSAQPVAPEKIKNAPPGSVLFLPDAEAAFAGLPDGCRLFVIGGAKVYESLLPRCSDLYLTVVNESHPGDTYFPDFEHLFRFHKTLETAPQYSVLHYVRME